MIAASKMYKPPENANRVQAIRSIFENKDVTTTKPLTPPKLITKSKTELDIRYSKCHQNLNRQLSDPSKRNIKRTPAFRLDKNAVVEKNSNRYHSKVKHDCDKIKSKCLGDEALSFSDIRSKFSCNQQSNNSEMSSTNVENAKNVSFLYAQPIPKALRVKKCDVTSKSDEENYHNKGTLKLENQDGDSASLTDTLKTALKKPLPSGPAPKKPPRTFLHSPQTPRGINTPSPNINKQFTDSLNKKLQKSTARGKGDPKYMLDKLENMLKNSQKRIRKTGKTDSEDSDDNISVGSKSARAPSRTNTSNTLPNSASNLFNLNCLNALGCSAAPYDRIKEPNSSFFIDCEKEEPLYAEPFQFRESVNQSKQKDGKKTSKEQRNSLYYMVRSFLFLL